MGVDMNADLLGETVTMNVHDVDDQLRALFSALSDTNRLRIFCLLREGERCVCDIEASVQLPQNLVSHHLRILRETGLIQPRREGRWVYYAINKAKLCALHPAVTVLIDPSNVSDALASC